MKTSDRAKQTKRAGLVDPDGTPCPVFVLSDRHDGVKVPWHAHRRIQFVHVSAGVLTAMTRNARFVVPPQRAVWIGSGVEHRIMGRAPFWLTTCYIEPALAAPAQTSRVVAVDRLTDELLIAASAFGGDYPVQGPEARLIAVLLDRLRALTQPTLRFRSQTILACGRLLIACSNIRRVTTPWPCWRLSPH